MARQQYSQPSTVSQSVIDVCEQHISIFDKYLIYQTGQYEYTCYIDKFLGGVKIVTVYRQNSSSVWHVSHSTADSFPASITYPYYSVSNVGLGKSIDMTAQTNIVTAVSVMGIFLVLCLKTMFFGWCKR